MPRSYQQLTYDERCQISALNARGDSPSQISRQLSRHRSSIIRELKRNSIEGKYQGSQAETKSRQRRFRKPTKMTPQLALIVEEELELQWSPVQISGRLKTEEAIMATMLFPLLQELLLLFHYFEVKDFLKNSLPIFLSLTLQPVYIICCTWFLNWPMS